jgi:hypothetical protein
MVDLDNGLITSWVDLTENLPDGEGIQVHQSGEGV